MVFVWRGIGIAVPIVFFIVGWIVSYWFEEGETKLGNASFMGWTSMYSGIVLTLLGLALFGGTEEEGADGVIYKKRHDFFWIPMLFWGLGLGGLSIYLLAFTGGEASAEVSAASTETVVPSGKPTTRMVNFYNPTKDTMLYIIADDATGQGLIERKKVAPMSFEQKELPVGTYMFASFNSKKETVLALPDEKYAEDSTKYEMFKDKKGSFYQRILKPKTKEDDDYDEAWFVMDGDHDFILVDVTSICSKNIKEKDIEAIDWKTMIMDQYDSKDLIEPLYNQYAKGKDISICAPGEEPPLEIKKTDLVYMLIPDEGAKDLDAFIGKKIVQICFHK